MDSTRPKLKVGKARMKVTLEQSWTNELQKRNGDAASRDYLFFTIPNACLGSASWEWHSSLEILRTVQFLLCVGRDC